MNYFFSQPAKVFSVLFVFFCAIFFTKSFYLGKTVYGDGRYYVSYLHSLAIDHDINFSNEFTYFQLPEVITTTNRISNVYAIGPALFWLPGYLPIHFLLRGDGYSFLYQLVIGFTSLLYGFTGLLLLYRTLIKKFETHLSLVAICSVALATNYLFYGAFDTVNSHAISFFLATVVTSLYLEKRHPSLIGIFIGFMALIRSQDILFLVLLLPNIYSLFLATCFSLLTFVPQLVVWQLLYGTFFRSPYLDQYHYFDWLNPQFLPVLFSDTNGLFYWTPIVALMLLGMFLPNLNNGVKRLPVLLLFFCQLFLIASWSFWWQGASYSGRMFISLLPLLSFGFIAVLQNVSFFLRVPLVFIFSLFNLGAILFYLITH